MTAHCLDDFEATNLAAVLTLAPDCLKEACDSLAHDLLGDDPLGHTPSRQLRESILAQVLFESIARQQRKGGKR